MPSEWFNYIFPRIPTNNIRRRQPMADGLVVFFLGGWPRAIRAMFCDSWRSFQVGLAVVLASIKALISTQISACRVVSAKTAARSPSSPRR